MGPDGTLFYRNALKIASASAPKGRSIFLIYADLIDKKGPVCYTSGQGRGSVWSHKDNFTRKI
jgi:hypothetical protein